MYREAIPNRRPMLYAVAASHRLSSEPRRLIADPENIVYVSTASIWEIAIKHAAGKGKSLPFDAIEIFKQAGYRTLDVSAHHAAQTERLPLLHNDPFDRLPVAQALIDSL